jgi:hypothetical protein
LWFHVILGLFFSVSVKNATGILIDCIELDRDDPWGKWEYPSQIHFQKSVYNFWYPQNLTNSLLLVWKSYQQHKQILTYFIYLNTWWKVCQPSETTFYSIHNVLERWTAHTEMATVTQCCE